MPEEPSERMPVPVTPRPPWRSPLRGTPLGVCSYISTLILPGVDGNDACNAAAAVAVAFEGNTPLRSLTLSSEEPSEAVESSLQPDDPSGMSLMDRSSAMKDASPDVSAWSLASSGLLDLATTAGGGGGVESVAAM